MFFMSFMVNFDVRLNESVSVKTGNKGVSIMAKTLRVGVVGAGKIWQSHWPGWAHSPHAEVAAFADMNAEALNRVCDEKGIQKRYASSEELFADPDIDIVDICTHSASHAPLALAALKAGKHVICEKPLAIQADDIEAMIEERDRQGVQLMAAQHYRFMNSTRVLKKEVEAGGLGDVYHARAWMLRRAGGSVRPTFVSRALSGGGACMDIGVHALDLTLWLMGNPKPLTVSAITQDRIRNLPGAFVGNGTAIPENWDVDEFGCAFVRLEGGKALVLEVSWLLNHVGGSDLELWLYGDKAGAKWPQNEIAEIDISNKKRSDRHLEWEEGMEAHARECVEFAESIVTGAPSPVPAEESLQVARILEGMYRSTLENREVHLS